MLIANLISSLYIKLDESCKALVSRGFSDFCPEPILRSSSLLVLLGVNTIYMQGQDQDESDGDDKPPFRGGEHDLDWRLGLAGQK